jgi:hypothetical protein
MTSDCIRRAGVCKLHSECNKIRSVRCWESKLVLKTLYQSRALHNDKLEISKTMGPSGILTPSGPLFGLGPTFVEITFWPSVGLDLEGGWLSDPDIRIIQSDAGLGNFEIGPGGVSRAKMYRNWKIQR